MKNRLIQSVMAVAVCLTAFSFVNANASEEAEKYPFGVVPDKMVGISMKDGDALHQKHVDELQALGKDCTVCHIDDNYESFMAADTLKSQDEKVAYLHRQCAGCHADMNEGPVITACRSCHSEEYAVK